MQGTEPSAYIKDYRKHGRCGTKGQEFIYIYIYKHVYKFFIYIHTHTQSPNTKKNVNSANIYNEKSIRSLQKNNFNGLCLIGGKCFGTGDLDPSLEEKEGPQGP